MNVVADHTVVVNARLVIDNAANTKPTSCCNDCAIKNCRTVDCPGITGYQGTARENRWHFESRVEEVPYHNQPLRIWCRQPDADCEYLAGCEILTQ
jgi:hypothetical protein